MFKSKKRRIQFKCKFTIESLEEVPINASLVHVEWHCRKTKHVILPKDKLCTEGRTHGKPVVKNRVVWQQFFEASVTIFVNEKTNCLEHCFLDLKIISQKTINSQQEKLGKVEVDISEYALSPKCTRSYLLRDSLLNSTLKLTLEMIQESGDRFFKWFVLQKHS